MEEPPGYSFNTRQNHWKYIGGVFERLSGGIFMGILAEIILEFLKISIRILDEIHRGSILGETPEGFMYDIFSFIIFLEKILAEFLKKALLELLKEFLFWISGGTPDRASGGYTAGFSNYWWNPYKKSFKIPGGIPDPKNPEDVPREIPWKIPEGIPWGTPG